MESFSFHKRWTNPEDFPTYETDETRVRADMQALFDELAAFLNTHVVPRLNADESSIRTVGDAVAALVSGTVPDGSLSAAKFPPGGAAGWELLPSAALEPQVVTIIDGTTITGLTLMNWEFRYSRSLGIMAYTYQIDASVTAPATLVLQHTSYRAATDALQPAGVFGSTYGLSAHAACRDVTNQGYMEHSIFLSGAYSGSIYVSGWYFCDGEGS